MGALAAWNACAFARFEGLAVKYIIAVIDSESGTASGDEYATIDEFNASLERDGHWILAAGIGAPATAKLNSDRSSTKPRVPTCVSTHNLLG
jgi:hypothetical protein